MGENGGGGVAWLTSPHLLFVRSSLEGLGTTKRGRGDREKELCGHAQTKQEQKKDKFTGLIVRSSWLEDQLQLAPARQ